MLSPQEKTISSLASPHDSGCTDDSADPQLRDSREARPELCHPHTPGSQAWDMQGREQQKQKKKQQSKADNAYYSHVSHREMPHQILTYEHSRLSHS